MLPLRALAISLVLIVSLVACSATGWVDCEGHFIYSQTDFTPEQQQWIENAGHRWNVWVGHQVVRTRPGNSSICSIKAGHTDKSNEAGEEYNRLQDITIDLDHEKKFSYLDQHHFEGVVMHEMGHALGYKHIITGRALMQPAGVSDFTALDKAACIAHRMCVEPIINEFVVNEYQ